MSLAGYGSRKSGAPLLRVGVIGCGHLALCVHLPILSRLPGVDITALADSDPARLQEARRRAPRAALFPDSRELFERATLDAVVICAPSALHAEMARTAFGRGVHVYVEKPIATSLGEAAEALAAWKRSSLVGMAGFNYRFNRLYRSARHTIASGRLGALVSARSVFSIAAREQPSWNQTRSSGGGVLLDLASHHVDLVHFLFDQEVRDVFARLHSQRSPDDTATLDLRLQDGLLVQSFFSLSSVEDDRWEVFGQHARLSVDRYLSLDCEITGALRDHARLKKMWSRLRSLSRSGYLIEKRLARWHEPSYRAALAHFIAAIRGRRPASPDLWDGYRALAVIAAAEESARTGKVVPVA